MNTDEIITDLWNNHDMTGTESKMLEVIGALLARIEELENKVDSLQSESALQESTRIWGAG